MSETQTAAAAALQEFARFGTEVSRQIARNVPDPYLSTNSPLGVLTLLRVLGPMRPVTIARTIGMTTGGITKVLHRLQRHDLIRREADPADGRGIIVQLTPTGVGLIDGVLDAVGETLSAFSEELIARRLAMTRFDRASQTI